MEVGFVVSDASDLGNSTTSDVPFELIWPYFEATGGRTSFRVSDNCEDFDKSIGFSGFGNTADSIAVVEGRPSSGNRVGSTRGGSLEILASGFGRCSDGTKTSGSSGIFSTIGSEGVEKAHS